FLLLLAIIGTLVPAIIGAVLSVIVNEGLATIFEDIAPEFSWFIFFDIGGVTLLLAIITAIFLTWLHFSNTIPQELRLCQQ
ncbi:MAG: hypothetical protein VSS52_006020, partial [Thiotrichaceae bacterium]|nr:hypothetical protein [Thiotrichaceae bacterium]